MSKHIQHRSFRFLFCRFVLIKVSLSGPPMSPPPPKTMSSKFWCISAMHTCGGHIFYHYAVSSSFSSLFMLSLQYKKYKTICCPPNKFQLKFGFFSLPHLALHIFLLKLHFLHHLGLYKYSSMPITKERAVGNRFYVFVSGPGIE